MTFTSSPPSTITNPVPSFTAGAPSGITNPVPSFTAAAPTGITNPVPSFSATAPLEAAFYSKFFKTTIESSLCTGGNPAPSWVDDGGGEGHISAVFAVGASDNKIWLGGGYSAGNFPIPAGKSFLIRAKIKADDVYDVSIGLSQTAGSYVISQGTKVDGDGTGIFQTATDWETVEIIVKRSLTQDDAVGLVPYFHLRDTQTGTLDVDQIELFTLDSVRRFTPVAPTTIT